MIGVHHLTFGNTYKMLPWLKWSTPISSIFVHDHITRKKTDINRYIECLRGRGGRNVADFFKWYELSTYVFVLKIKTTKVLQKAKIGGKTRIYAVFCCILAWFPWIWVFQVLPTKRILAAKTWPLRSSTRGARPHFCCRYVVLATHWPPKTSISMCGHQAQIPKFRKICKIFERSGLE